MHSNVISKMDTSLNEVVEYAFNIHNQKILMNDLIDSRIKISWKGKIMCYCGEEKKKVYRSGFCYNCYWTLPQASQSIFKPELCTAHLNIEERDLEYEKKIQLKPHILYLAFSSSLKVGVTRKSQVPFRWIDQGAISAIEIAEFPNRYLAGISEVELKKYYSDKTNWREMLKTKNLEINLELERKNCFQNIPNEAKNNISKDSFSQININYPVIKHPTKPKSLNIIKEGFFEGKLVGIKGQYLIFDDETVFNIRSNEGLVINLSVL